MLEQFSQSNLFWASLEEYSREDKHLRDLANQRYVWRFPWLDTVGENGVYLVLGGRQIGKTSSMKSFILERLMNDGFLPNQVLYLPCDTIVDRVELLHLLRAFFSSIDKRQRSLLVIDEVTFVRDWQLTVKALLDEGAAENSIIIISGSDSILLEDGAAGFPGTARRGMYGRDVVLKPLSFGEYVDITKSIESNLEEKFKSYLQCGGYLSAINDLHKNGTIGHSTFATYQQWLLSDFVRKGKDRRRVIEVLRVLTLRLATQVSFSNLAGECQSLSTETMIDYLHHLERLGIIRVLGAFDQNSLGTFLKKAKKIHFCDPFIARSSAELLKQEGLIASKFELSESALVEAMVVEALARIGRVSYIKAAGEVDAVSIFDGQFTPVEVKWSEQVRTAELKQILKYPRGLVLSLQRGTGRISQIDSMNILDFLAGNVRQFVEGVGGKSSS